MKRKFAKHIAVTLVVTLISGMTVSGNSGVAAEISTNESTSVETITETETSTDESTQIETRTGEQITDETTTEETTVDETTIEETTTEEITTEEPTTEEPTTPEYIIIDGVYKVKDGVLVEYLGNKEDEEVTELVIPKEIEKIDNLVFANCAFIVTVTFESGSLLKEIGNYAFEECSNMTSIKLPKGLKKIGKMAFNKCTSLTELTIPATVTSGEEILGKSKSVKKVTFASGIKEIPNDILKYAYSVESVSMKSGVKAIGNRAFYKCKFQSQ